MSSSSGITGSTPLSELLFRKSEECQKEVLFKVIDSLICSICQDYMYIPMMIECGHNYCYGCLSTWFNSNPEVELSCPHCRGKVDNMPCLNSALQQLLQTVIEASSAGKGDKLLESKLKKILDAKKLCDDEYRKDSDDNQLFRGVFQNTAVGIADEEDDGILRCSNCHWELEDDEDDVCPHCNMRIRSRPGRTQASPSESERRAEPTQASLDESDGYESYGFIEPAERYFDGSYYTETTWAAYIYATKIAALVNGVTHADEMVERYYNSEFSYFSWDIRFPLIFLSFSLADGTVVYVPSYAIYVSLVNPRMKVKVIRAIGILRKLQNVEVSERQGVIADLLTHWWDFEVDTSPVDRAQIQREIREYGAIATKYESLIREALERHLNEDYTSPSALSPSGFHFNYPFLVERKTTKGERVLFPSYSMFVKTDPDLTDGQRENLLYYVTRLEQSIIRRGDFSQTTQTSSQTGSQDEEYDSVNDFIASDDDVDGVAEHSDASSVRASSGSSERSSREGPDSEDPDSDYFEHNEGDGYVSGDSLDDGDHAVRTRPEFTDSEQEQDEEDEDDSSKVRIPRKRNRAIVEISDEDSA